MKSEERDSLRVSGVSIVIDSVVLAVSQFLLLLLPLIGVDVGLEAVAEQKITDLNDTSQMLFENLQKKKIKECFIFSR